MFTPLSLANGTIPATSVWDLVPDSGKKQAEICLGIAKNNPESNCPVEWKTDFVDNSLQHLLDVWEMFSVQYLVPDSPPTALLDRVCTGCLSVTWLVPSHLIPQFVKRAKVNTTFFQRHRILKVTVSGEIIYEEEVTMKSIEVSSMVPTVCPLL